MGVGYIPSSKIREYGRDELGLLEDENDRFFAIIRQMDDEYVRLSNAKTTNNSDRQIPIDDVEGLKSFFSGLEARDKSVPQKPRPKK